MVKEQLAKMINPQLRKGKFRWYYVLKGKNGRILSTSQKYFSKSNAVRAIHDAGYDTYEVQ